MRTISEPECVVSRPLSEWRPISELTEGWDKGGGACLAEEVDGWVAASKRKRCYLNTFNWFPHQPFHVTGHITYYHARKKKKRRATSGCVSRVHVPVNKLNTEEREMERSVICQGCLIPSELDQVSEGHINKV